MYFDSNAIDLSSMQKQDLEIVQLDSKNLKESLTEQRLKKITNSCIKIDRNSVDFSENQSINANGHFFRVSNNRVFLGTLSGNNQKSKVMNQSYGLVSANMTNNAEKAHSITTNRFERPNTNKAYCTLKDLDNSLNYTNYNWENKDYLKKYLTKGYLNTRTPYQNKPVSEAFRQKQIEANKESQATYDINGNPKKFDDKSFVDYAQTDNRLGRNFSELETRELAKYLRKSSEPNTKRRQNFKKQSKLVVCPQYETQF